MISFQPSRDVTDLGDLSLVIIIVMFFARVPRTDSGGFTRVHIRLVKCVASTCLHVKHRDASGNAVAFEHFANDWVECWMCCFGVLVRYATVVESEQVQK